MFYPHVCLKTTMFYSICPDVIFQIFLPPSRPIMSYHVINHVTSMSCASSSSIKKEKKIKRKLLYNQKIKENKIKFIEVQVSHNTSLLSI